DLPVLTELIGFKPIKVTILPEGIFAGYKAQRQSEGSDLAHLKPPHINPSEKVLASLGVQAGAVPEPRVTVNA
ncbi:MAG TPA: GH3 auxin-responsive promoter, partial [Dehalococcoidia bacterium]